MIAKSFGMRAFKICGSILLALSLLNAGNTLADQSIRLIESDSGKTVEIAIGERLEIVLLGKPTAGYVWEISRFDPARLRFNKTEPLFVDKAIGSDSVEILNFEAVATGRSELELIFHRPFEKHKAPLKTFAVTVIVTK